jgi:hypothetical protein
VAGKTTRFSLTESYSSDRTDEEYKVPHVGSGWARPGCIRNGLLPLQENVVTAILGSVKEVSWLVEEVWPVERHDGRRDG